MQLQNNQGVFRVAVIGRPNVGKSSLFNYLTRSRKAVVKDQPGVTRDILTGSADWWGKQWEVLDTGGLTRSKDTFSPLIYRQVLSVLRYVNLLVVMMDAKSGLTPEDRDIVRVAKESGRPFFIVVNKVDRQQDAEEKSAEFYEFGMDVLPVSIERRDNTDKIVEKIIEHIPESMLAEQDSIKVAIVGKPNAGKSSLGNAILEDDRLIVSEIAGTTVDAVEVKFKHRDQLFTFVDTAGLRRQSSRLSKGDGVEILSSYKSYDAIEKADMVFLVIDATLGPSEQDAKLIQHCYDEGKAIIVVANKMDLAKNLQDEVKTWFRDRVDFEFHFLSDLPIVFTSAETGLGVKALLDKAVDVWRRMEVKITTRELNDFFYDVIRQAPSPVYRTTNVKFYYLTQTAQKPPSFIAFANHPEGVTTAYRRFLINRIQAQWGLQGLPVRVYIMKST